MEKNNEKQEKVEKEKPNLPKKLENITSEKIKGRIVIFDPENSEFAKNLKLDKVGDYTQKK